LFLPEFSILTALFVNEEIMSTLLNNNSMLEDNNNITILDS
jgi:hypothetical protein